MAGSSVITNRGRRAGGAPAAPLRDDGDGPAAGAHKVNRERADETVTSFGRGAHDHGVRLQFAGKTDDLGEGIADAFDEFGPDPDPATLRLDRFPQFTCDVIVGLLYLRGRAASATML